MLSNRNEHSLCFHCLFRAGRSSAAHAGIPFHEIDDCASDFVARQYSSATGCRFRSHPGAPCPLPLLRRSARNYACNYARTLRTRLRRQCRLPEIPAGGGETAPPRLLSTSLSPESLLLRQEFWQTVSCALKQLSPAYRDLIVRHDLAGESVADLSIALGRTHATVQKTLQRARRRLQQLLERQGTAESFLRAYLPEFPETG